MFHLHKWSKWSDPIKVPMVYTTFRTGTKTHGYEDVQRRTCKKCNAVQERTL